MVRCYGYGILLLLCLDLCRSRDLGVYQNATRTMPVLGDPDGVATESVYGNEVKLRAANNLPAGTTFIDTSTILPSGLLTQFRLYLFMESNNGANNTSTADDTLIAVQIWRETATMDEYRLVWQRVASLSKTWSGVYTFEFPVTEAPLVEHGDRVGWTGEGRPGALSVSYSPHGTRLAHRPWGEGGGGPREGVTTKFSAYGQPVTPSVAVTVRTIADVLMDRPSPGPWRPLTVVLAVLLLVLLIALGIWAFRRQPSLGNAVRVAVRKVRSYKVSRKEKNRNTHNSNNINNTNTPDINNILTIDGNVRRNFTEFRPVSQSPHNLELDWSGRRRVAAVVPSLSSPMDVTPTSVTGRYETIHDLVVETPILPRRVSPVSHNYLKLEDEGSFVSGSVSMRSSTVDISGIPSALGGSMPSLSTDHPTESAPQVTPLPQTMPRLLFRNSPIMQHRASPPCLRRHPEGRTDFSPLPCPRLTKKVRSMPTFMGNIEIRRRGSGDSQASADSAPIEVTSRVPPIEVTSCVPLTTIINVNPPTPEDDDDYLPISVGECEEYLEPTATPSEHAHSPGDAASPDYEPLQRSETSGGPRGSRIPEYDDSHIVNMMAQWYCDGMAPLDEICDADMFNKILQDYEAKKAKRTSELDSQVNVKSNDDYVPMNAVMHIDTDPDTDPYSTAVRPKGSVGGGDDVMLQGLMPPTPELPPKNESYSSLVKKFGLPQSPGVAAN